MTREPWDRDLAGALRGWGWRPSVAGAFGGGGPMLPALCGGGFAGVGPSAEAVCAISSEDG